MCMIAMCWTKWSNERIAGMPVKKGATTKHASRCARRRSPCQIPLCVVGKIQSRRHSTRAVDLDGILLHGFRHTARRRDKHDRRSSICAAQFFCATRPLAAEKDEEDELNGSARSTVWPWFGHGCHRAVCHTLPTARCRYPSARTDSLTAINQGCRQARTCQLMKFNVLPFVASKVLCLLITSNGRGTSGGCSKHLPAHGDRVFCASHPV